MVSGGEMIPFTLSLTYDRPAALLEPDHGGEGGHLILLVIDWQTKTISAETRDPKDCTAPETRWRGLEDAYSLPPLVDATQLRDWVETEVVPRAAVLEEAYQTVWEDVERFGRFPGHEREKETFDAWMDQVEPPLHDGGLWPVGDWLAGGVEEISYETTDAALDSLVDTIVREAAAENGVLVGGAEAVRAYLRDLRQQLRDAIPEPDTYQIRGYAVLEGVAKDFGGTAHVTLARKYSGKRVKIVVID